MLTLLDVVKRTTEFFEKHGIESARLNAELIVAHALGMNRMKVYLQFERLLTQPELEAIRPLVRRRATREPLAYVLGTAAFGDLMLKVDKRVLIPRPETEQLVELIQTTFAALPSPCAILDLGTGSGALALALAKLFPQARVVAIDASEDALAVARENAALTGLDSRVTFRHSEWFSAFAAGERYDLIVANPPYLTEEEVRTAEPEVRDYEPRQALIASEAGMADLRTIIETAPRHLAPAGFLFLETGVDQHPALLEICRGASLIELQSMPDLNGRSRFLSARAGG